MPEARAQPNLLFILTDEQRIDTLAAYGAPFVDAPNLNRLAERSFVLDAVCCQPVCTPSRASLQTGLWPHQHEVVENNTRLPDHTPTLAEMLGDRYESVYVGKWHLGDEITAQRGYGTWISIEDKIYRPFYSNPDDLERRSDYDAFLRSQGFAPDDRAEDGADCFSREFTAGFAEQYTKARFVGREAARLIRERAGTDRPWFLTASMLEPHMPFFGPLNDRHDPDALPVGPAFARPPEGPVPEPVRQRVDKYRETGYAGYPLQTEADWRRLRANYFGLVTLVDQAVGDMLEALDASGQAENTVVIFTSDHGDLMGDHALLEKCLLYDEAIRVPWLIHDPRRSRQQVRLEGRVSHIDFVPTLLGLAGVAAPGHLAGKSLVPSLDAGRLVDPGPVISEWYDDRAVIAPDGWKYVHRPADVCELYDLNQDPAELRNRIEDPATTEVQSRLQALIH